MLKSVEYLLGREDGWSNKAEATNHHVVLFVFHPRISGDALTIGGAPHFRHRRAERFACRLD